MVKLGDLVRDKISGFEGIAHSRTEWLYNCVRVGVAPTKLHEGKLVESAVFDEDQLEVIKMQVREPVKPRKVVTGGDRPTPGRHENPKR